MHGTVIYLNSFKSCCSLNVFDCIEMDEKLENVREVRRGGKVLDERNISWEFLPSQNTSVSSQSQKFSLQMFFLDSTERGRSSINKTTL